MRKILMSTLMCLTLILLAACNFPRPGQETPPGAASPLEAGPPSQEPASAECGYVWARQALPELSDQLNAALKTIQPQAAGYAEAYGENCVNSQGETVRFLAMETDFHITLKAENLDDTQALGKLIEQVMEVLIEFPVDSTPGPQPGYVGITFEAPTDELRLWRTRADIETALAKGLTGEKLFHALQAK